MTKGINQFTTTLRTIVVEVNDASSELRLQAQQSREKAEENVAQIDQQKHQLETIAAAATELNHSVATVAQTVNETAEQALNATRLTDNVVHEIGLCCVIRFRSRVALLRLIVSQYGKF
ncbi:hypothetical protein ACQ5T5_07490, partial [Vibrio cholerae]